MELATVLARLDITAPAPALSRGWDESVQSRPPGEIFFLEEKFVRTGCEYLALPADVRELAVQTANRIRVNPALAEGGQVYRRDGQMNGAAGLTETEGVWTSDLRYETAFIIGNPIDAVLGAASPKPVRLSRADWTEVLQPGDPVLDVHIPATGPMPAQDCADSVYRAVEFFQKHFPENRPRGP